MNKSFHSFVTGEQHPVVSIRSGSGLKDEDTGVYLQNSYTDYNEFRDQEKNSALPLEIFLKYF